jgi:putative FmdB family regulatory protein
MPVYEYECKSCGKRFEKMQPFTAEPLTECVNCGQGPIRRVFQPVGVIFKGSGWYITDSRKSESASIDKKPSAETSGDTSKSDSPAPSGDTKTESAPAKATVVDSSPAVD